MTRPAIAERGTPGEPGKDRGGLVLAVGIAALLLLAGVWRYRDVFYSASGPARAAGMRLGEVAAPRALTDLAGRKVELPLGTEATLLAFSARDCPACSTESDVWRALYQAGRQRGIRVSILLRDREPEKIRRYLQANDLADLPVLYDPEGKVFAQYKVTETPQYLLFDRRGRLILRRVGASDTQGLTPEREVSAVLTAAQAARSIPVISRSERLR